MLDNSSSSDLHTFNSSLAKLEILQPSYYFAGRKAGSANDAISRAPLQKILPCLVNVFGVPVVTLICASFVDG